MIQPLQYTLHHTLQYTLHHTLQYTLHDKRLKFIVNELISNSCKQILIKDLLITIC